MKLEHLTGMQTGYTMGMDKEGREHLVVCVKGTYSIPKNGDIPRLADVQEPLAVADTFTGEPGLSAPVYESDYAPVKPRCDILFNGFAYAPKGHPATKVPVTLRFGRMVKSFNVVGDRTWDAGAMSPKPSWIKPFLRMPITYDRAFGGVDDSQGDPKKVHALMENPIGVGYHHYIGKKWIDGQPMPNTEELKRPIKKPDAGYRPMSFGPIGRNWQPRGALAGTYDQDWLDNIFPFLPPDFDNSYFQAAPLEQQVPYPKGGEPVVLTNLTSEGNLHFPFPPINLLVWFFLKNGEEREAKAVVDTVMIEPEENRFTVTCRASTALKKNMLEMQLAVVGQDPNDKDKIVASNETTFPLTDHTVEGEVFYEDAEE